MKAHNHLISISSNSWDGFNLGFLDTHFQFPQVSQNKVKRTEETMRLKMITMMTKLSSFAACWIHSCNGMDTYIYIWGVRSTLASFGKRRNRKRNPLQIWSLQTECRCRIESTLLVCNKQFTVLYFCFTYGDHHSRARKAHYTSAEKVFICFFYNCCTNHLCLLLRTEYP